MKNIFFYETVIGKLGIAADGESVTNIFFENSLPETGFEIKETKLIKKAFRELDEYFAGKRKKFTVPINPAGTEFQKKAWEALCKIEYGKTKSYKEIAELCGCPKGYRAVGMANNRNPIPIIIPCHRVIGSDGKPVGFGGGIDVKKKLLETEKADIKF